MRKEQLAKLRLQRRNVCWEKCEKHRIRGIWWRNILHPLLIKLVKINRIFTGQKINLIGDRRHMDTKPVIYGFTHIGVEDVQILTEAIKEHVVLFAGDPQITYYTFGGFLFWINGVVWCDTESKIDRRIAEEIAIEYLKQGENLAIYPEGVWNITPDLPVLPLFPGIIRMAQKTGCGIVPVAVDHNGNDYYVNIGEEFYVTGCENKETAEKARKELRDKMAALRWEIWEAMPHGVRGEYGRYADREKEYLRSVLDQWKDRKTGRQVYTEELVTRRTYKEKRSEI